MRLFLLFFLFYFIFIFGSCTKYQPSDPAFFIRAGRVSVATTAAQGSGSHKITDLWLYVNGQFEGAYPVGNLMPIVSNNAKAKINIFAGIKNNGFSDTRIYWPFYERLDFDSLVPAGETIQRDFTFRYNPSTTFTWTENFDAGFGSVGLSKSPISDTTFKIASQADSFEGKSMELGLSGSGLIAQVQSQGSTGQGFVFLPKNTPNVYLELNYKCNSEFSIGLITEKSEIIEVIYLNPKPDWNKIYIKLADAINNGSTSNTFKIYFKLLKKDVENPRVFLDNIKLVYIPIS